jgi:hypothetical protein
MQLFVSVLAVFGLKFVHDEFLKTALLSTSLNTLIYVVLIGVVTVIIIYFVIHIFRVLAERMAWKRSGGRDYS